MGGIEFGKAVKEMREAQGLFSKKLSLSSGMSPYYVSQLERGDIKNPDRYACEQILEKIGISNEEAHKMLDHFDIKKDTQFSKRKTWLR